MESADGDWKKFKKLVTFYFGARTEMIIDEFKKSFKKDFKKLP